jgi:archaeal flagellar protein FlaJ
MPATPTLPASGARLGSPPPAPLPAPSGPVIVRVKRGEQPSHSTLTPFQQWAWKTFRARIQAKPPDPTLEENLLKAHMRIRADEYAAFCFAALLIIVAAATVGGIVLGVVAYLSIGVLGFVLTPIVAIGGSFLGNLVLTSAPGSRASARGKDIDKRISSAMSFVSAMASADVNIDAIFKELSRQKIYGQIAEEAAWITRDTELLGVDILTAIRTGASRTPSKRFQDFLQGVVTTATSGGQLKPYFLAKAEQYEQENKLEMLQRVETMGLLAETFVTVVVAFPLFLVIIIAIFAIVGGGGAFLVEILWAIVGLMIPLAQVGFVFIMWTLAQET